MNEAQDNIAERLGYAAFMAEAERVRERYDRARENIDWLSAPKPVWACGTPLLLDPDA